MVSMKYEYIEVNDGCRLAFQTSLPLNPTGKEDSAYKTMILLVHGFSGSSEVFRRNFESLSSLGWTVAVDLRGHGQSAHSPGGYHLARLAVDLKETIGYLRDCTSTYVKVVPMGSSLGAALLLTYYELFGSDSLAGMVFIDQIPYHDKTIPNDWNQSETHHGFFDSASLLASQKPWIEDPDSASRGLAGVGLGYRFDPRPDDNVTPEQSKADEDSFVEIASKCDGTWLSKLLADHARYDHREACELIRLPTLTIAGRRSGLWPVEGPKEIVRRIKKGIADEGVQSVSYEPQWVEFETGHFPYWEEPERFHDVIKTFLESYVIEKS